MTAPLGKLHNRPRILGVAGGNRKLTFFSNLDYYYPLDEPNQAGTYWDWSKNGNELTVGSGSTLPNASTGLIGGSQLFVPGDTDTLQVADNVYTKHDSDAVSITICFWVYFTAPTMSASQALVSKRGNIDAIDYSIYTGISGSTVRILYSVTINSTGVSISSPYQDYATYWLNQWRMVTVFHNTSIKTFGIKIDNDSWTTSTYTESFNPTGTVPLRLGTLTGTNNLLDGRLDNLYKWSRVLKDEEITQLYNGGNGLAIVSDSNSYFMDTLNPTQAIMYSVSRKLVSSYKGALFRVRRSSDNAETNIWAKDDGTVDTDYLKTFVGNSSGFVTALYAQNSNRDDDLIQTSTSSQPRVVLSGALITMASGKLAMSFNGTSMYLERRSAATFTGVTVQQISAVLRPLVNCTPDVGHGTVFSYGVTTGAFATQYITITSTLSGETSAVTTAGGNGIGSSQTNLWTNGADTTTTFNTVSNTGVYGTTSVSYSLTAGGGMSADYSPAGNANLTSANGAKFAIGATRTGASTLTNYFNGYIPEVIVYNVDNTTNLATVTSNQRTFYGAA